MKKPNNLKPSRLFSDELIDPLLGTGGARMPSSCSAKAAVSGLVYDRERLEEATWVGGQPVRHPVR